MFREKMRLAQHGKAKSYNALVVFLVVSRFISEICTGFVWSLSNYVWSMLAVVGICVFIWPYMVLKRYLTESILHKYWPVFVYLLYAATRVKVSDPYSLKCYLSEFIVWVLFVCTIQICKFDRRAAKNIEDWVIRFVKIITVIGMVQLTLAVLSQHIFNPMKILEMRAVKGIFAHENIFIVFMIPFVFYFIKKRLFFWAFLHMVACLGTGTRSPFMAAACLALIIGKSVFNRKITGKDIVLTVLIIAIAYAVLIRTQMAAISFATPVYYELTNERMSGATLQWRVLFWRHFLVFKDYFSFFAGNGIGAADNLAVYYTSGDISYPHCDYVRVYYDLGVVGLAVFINLIVFMLRLIKKSITVRTDYVLIMYFLVICFYITDNFLFTTLSMLLYMFIASVIGAREAPAGGA